MVRQEAIGELKKMRREIRKRDTYDEDQEWEKISRGLHWQNSFGKLA
jgi:hypothetical protein